MVLVEGAGKASAGSVVASEMIVEPAQVPVPFTLDYSHVAIDSIMHGDMEPFAPFSSATPWLLVVSVETLQWLCVAAGIAGVAGLLFLRWLELKGSR